MFFFKVFPNSEMDVILHLCPQRSPHLSGLLSPLSLQDSEFTQQCQITSSDVSCSRREGANGVTVDALHYTGTGSDLVVLINHLLWQSFESTHFKTKSMNDGSQWQKLAFQVIFIIILLL